MNVITERHLRVFFEVCKHMNMTKASKELFVSQPAISKTIHDIEQDYGVKLFERWNKCLYLTPEGANLYEYSKQVVNLLDSIDTSMKARNSKDIIRVGASITIGTSILSDIISGYCLQNDSVRIEALVDNTPVIEQALLQSQLDIAFVEGRLTSLEVKSETVGSTEIVLVVNRLHELYDRQDVQLEDLDGLDFIVREKGSRTREIFALEMEKNNLRWNPAWSCHNTQTIKNAVDAGLGVGVLSKLSVRKRLESGRFRAINVFSEPLELYIRVAYTNNKYFSQNLTSFRDYAAEHVGKLAGEKNNNLRLSK